MRSWSEVDPEVFRGQDERGDGWVQRDRKAGAELCGWRRGNGNGEDIEFRRLLTVP